MIAVRTTSPVMRHRRRADSTRIPADPTTDPATAKQRKKAHPALAGCAFQTDEVVEPSRLAPEVRGVLLREVRPLFRQIVGRKDGRDWACRHTRTTIDALDRIDEQLVGLAVTGFILLG